jgi:para-nitrobenzyl esterase
MKLNRRTFIRTAGWGIAGFGLTSTGISSYAATGKQDATDPDDDQWVFIGKDYAQVDTVYGKVQGYIFKGIHTFLGIPYGADTSGKNRFMPPEPPEPWSETFPAFWWPNSAPQSIGDRFNRKVDVWLDRWNYDALSENCLGMNVWSPGLDNKKRPVLLWFHGGGFTNGNAIEQDTYHGENLARKGDIVFCSINHRLNAFGFADFSTIDPQFKQSGNVGMLDCVAALQWIRDNIANFGGDPHNVTIMGQSGGGRKVCTLTSMPSAKGLFSKAVVLSGATNRVADKDLSEKLGERIFREAGVKNMEELQSIPWRDYSEIAEGALRKLNAELRANGFTGRTGWEPVVDGEVIPAQPYDPDPTPYAADIPMITCSTSQEYSPSKNDGSLEAITLDGVKDKLREVYKEKTGEIVDAYAAVFPNEKPIDIWALIISNRQRNLNLANVKCRQKAPTYVAWFDWRPPLLDNRYKAFHCCDISFWLYNTDRMFSHTGGGSRPRKLADKMSGALIRFMKTGNPNGGGLPDWPRYTATKGETMVLNDRPAVKNDPDGEARKYLPA